MGPLKCTGHKIKSIKHNQLFPNEGHRSLSKCMQSYFGLMRTGLLLFIGATNITKHNEATNITKKQ